MNAGRLRIGRKCAKGFSLVELAVVVIIIGVLAASWSLTLTRQGASAGYGAYTVTFTEDGYDAANSFIEAQPYINPMGT